MRGIQGHLLEIYGVEALPGPIRIITDAVLDNDRFRGVFFDALRVKVRDKSIVRSKAVHIRPDCLCRQGPKIDLRRQCH
nr:transposase [Komagataeibacter nataicola]